MTGIYQNTLLAMYMMLPSSDRNISKHTSCNVHDVTKKIVEEENDHLAILCLFDVILKHIYELQ